jgi:hypothetical protein
VSLWENKIFLLPSANVQYVPETYINTTEIENVQRSIERNGEVLSSENFILEENKNTSLPSADVQYILGIEIITTEIENIKRSIELDLNTNNLEKVMDEKKEFFLQLLEGKLWITLYWIFEP